MHAAELVRWNQKINLTAITDPFEVAVKHFLDSLPAARLLPKDATLLDIGSGGGLPGLPLKILMPSLSITLIDASRKKVNFLKNWPSEGLSKPAFYDYIQLNLSKNQGMNRSSEAQFFGNDQKFFP